MGTRAEIAGLIPTVPCFVSVRACDVTESVLTLYSKCLHGVWGSLGGGFVIVLCLNCVSRTIMVNMVSLVMHPVCFETSPQPSRHYTMPSKSDVPSYQHNTNGHNHIHADASYECCRTHLSTCTKTCTHRVG